ncbi:MAG: preprotein translocase subunit SecE [Clostridiales bacterium]|nr:preprotein translocase subunit SecE [Clostridiales bacterium]
MAEATEKTENKNEKAAKPNVVVSFWKGFKTEFKKVIWPDRVTVGKQTAVVVAITLALGVVIAILDLIFKYGFSFII